jgi:phosphoribosylglycinamide formyltransferase 1
MINVAVFASGSGSNAEKIAEHFIDRQDSRIRLIFTNNKDAGVITRARNLNIPCEIISNDRFKDGNDVLKKLEENKIDFIVLAGFLLLIPKILIERYKGRIINIHPALLPLHGGKGFYGNNVHKAVIASGSLMSGITIHHVNEKFDDGEIIFQAACHVDKDETPESLAEKIHKLEYKYFPTVIEKTIAAIFHNKS